MWPACWRLQDYDVIENKCHSLFHRPAHCMPGSLSPAQDIRTRTAAGGRTGGGDKSKRVFYDCNTYYYTGPRGGEGRLGALGIAFPRLFKGMPPFWDGMLNGGQLEDSFSQAHAEIGRCVYKNAAINRFNAWPRACNFIWPS